jgi:hypothetical protein
MTKRRGGLEANAITTAAIARDAEREGRIEEAKAIRAEVERFRSTGIQKRMTNGKIKRFKNLRTFNGECASRSDGGKNAMICELSSIRKLADGTGMASVKVTAPSYLTSNARREGTWRLHFASFDILKRHLQNRVYASESSIPGSVVKLRGNIKR